MSKPYQDELLEDWPRDSDGNLLLKAGAAGQEEDKAARRDSLRLEDSTAASFEVEEEDDASTSAVASVSATKHARTVHFSETSQLYTYERESMSLLRSLAYKEQDRRRFSREAMQDGLVIKTLVDEAPHTSVAESMTYLLRQGIIGREEVVGIEHFSLGQPSSLPVIRRRHAVAVLRKQQQLLQLLHEQKVEDKDVALSLGKFAESISLRSAQRARVRAGMTASSA